IFARLAVTEPLVRVQHLPHGTDVAPEIVVLGHLPLDLLAAVEHGRVVPAAQGFADTQERRLGLLAHEVHRDLARQDDLLVARLAPKLLGRDAVVARDGLDDLLGGEGLLPRVVEDVLEDLLRELCRDRNGVERGIGDDPRERALELADVRDDALREEIDDRRRHRDTLRLGLRAQDRDACLQVGRADIGDESPLEARAQTILETLDRLGRPIAREHDLLPFLVDRVEGVEELFLRPLFAGEELDVVDEEDVDAAVPLAELLALLSADGVDELVRELLARRVGDALLRMTPRHGVTDRVHEMRLAEPRAPVDEERVVRMTRALRHGERGGAADAVVGAAAGTEATGRSERAEAAVMLTKRTSTVRESRRWRVSRTCVRYLFSSHSRANAFGTPIMKTSSSSETIAVSLNHVS